MEKPMFVERYRDLEFIRVELERLEVEFSLHPDTKPLAQDSVGKVLYEIEESPLVLAANLIHIRSLVTGASEAIISIGAADASIRWLFASRSTDTLFLPFAILSAITMRLLNMLTIASNDDLQIEGTTSLKWEENTYLVRGRFGWESSGLLLRLAYESADSHGVENRLLRA